MQFYQRAFLLLFCSATLLGCASNAPIRSYDASSNTTVYRSDNVAIGQTSSGSYGSGGSAAIAMRVTSKCSGVNCTPKSASLQFSMEGSADGGFASRTLSISADGVDYSFGSRVQRTGVESGELPLTQNLKVTGIPFSDLKEIASAKAIEGTLGGLDLDMKSAQPVLKEFVAMAENPEDGGDDS
jgi:hypothetical protein